jgi:cation transport regulator ChaB
MKTIQKIFALGADHYFQQFANAMPTQQRKALMAMQNCRTSRMGNNMFCCPRCGKTETLPRSCSNRHCPTCQSDKGRQWLDTHRDNMLPCNYFMVSFTVPQQLRRIIRSHHKTLYAAMFSCAWNSIQLLAKDPRHLGAHTVGAIAVLHTWTRQIEYHPHIHFLVPAGGLDRQGNWVHSRQDFFLPVRALSRIFRAKIRDALTQAGLYDSVDPHAWTIDWNVNCENKGNGMRALGYLSAYLFRVAISNSRIRRADADTVTFQYKKQKSDKLKNTTIPTTEFIRRFLQHVLPKGFVKVRHYGLLAANGSHDFKKLAQMILQGFADTWHENTRPTTATGLRCSCGAAMKLLALLLPPLPQEVRLQT